jgi:hypothetical protein
MPRPRIRAVPWLVLFEAAVRAREHWSKLAPKDRRHLGELVRKSRGLPGNLTAKERQEFRRLVGRLELARLGRDLMPFARRMRQGRGR